MCQAGRRRAHEGLSILIVEHHARPVEIVIDVSDPSPEVPFIFISVRAVDMVEELRRTGIVSKLVRIDVEGIRPYLW